MSARAWMVRILEREELCLKNGLVAIGWANARGLDASGLTLQGLKSIVQASYPQYRSPQALGQVAGILWRFVREIQVDDWIVAPTWTGLNLGRVTGPIMYDEYSANLDSAWRYAVNWVRIEIARESASAPLRARCSSRQTCVEATEFVPELERLSRDVGKPNLAVAIARSEAKDAIGKVLDYQLTPTDLELLVVKLAEASGAQVEQPGKSYGDKQGDVDVIARYTFPSFSIGYQVKKHDGGTETDRPAVQQIIDAMRDERLDIDIGCVVTTAPAFSQAAQALAASSEIGPVRLMSRTDLIHWILSVGISSIE